VARLDSFILAMARKIVVTFKRIDFVLKKGSTVWHHLHTFFGIDVTPEKRDLYIYCFGNLSA
jgi:hypothetical protein